MSAIRLSTSFSEKADRLLPKPSALRLVVSRTGGNHEAPEFQSEHQPLLRRLMSLLTSMRSSTYLASVVGTGVALKPASVSDLTSASFDFVLRSLSVRHRNLIS